jgi:DNA end-binding protein Ku
MARGIWKGTLGFGLVSIGVELFSAEKPERLDLDLLDRRDHSRIRYRKVNESTGEEVPAGEILRGYDTSPPSTRTRKPSSCTSSATTTSCAR